MKIVPFFAVFIGMLAISFATATHAQIDRNASAERACQTKYDDIFANLNSSSPNKRRVSDEEISWALRYERVKKANKPCSEADAPPDVAAVSDKPQASTAQTHATGHAVVEPGGSSRALAGQAAYNRGDFATARTDYQSGCFSDGNGAACNNLGAMATKGQGGAKDLPLARRAYQQGCAKGVAKACENYGSMLKSGRGGPQDIVGAVAPQTMACKAGLATSCYELGTSYFYGRIGNGPDYAKARQYLAKACPGYAADGCYALAISQRDGKGGPVDAVGAAKSFQLSCEAGKSDGCLEYGFAQYSGAGIAKDFVGARNSFSQACNIGNGGACMNAGMMARDGQGGPVDPAAAKRFFNLGCKLGIQDGCSLAGRVGT